MTHDDGDGVVDVGEEMVMTMKVVIVLIKKCCDRRRPNIAEVDMLMPTIEVAEFFPSRLLLAHIVVDPHSPAGVQLPRT